MKKQNKELLYFRTILFIAVLIVTLSGCAKTTITPSQETCLESVCDTIGIPETDLADESDLLELTNAYDKTDGREESTDVPVKVLDMSYIDTEEKAMFFAALVESGAVEAIKDSLWSEELGKKYGVPEEHIKGYQPPKSSVEQPPQETQPPTAEPVPVREDGYRDDLAQQMFAKVNEYRVQNGVFELSWNSELENGAKIRAKEVVGTWGHTRPDGSMWYDLTGRDTGENLVKGSFYGGSLDDSEAVEGCFNSWINSAGHRENMLNVQDDYKSSVISCYYSNGTYYFVQIFKL